MKSSQRQQKPYSARTHSVDALAPSTSFPWCSTSHYRAASTVALVLSVLGMGSAEAQVCNVNTPVFFANCASVASGQVDPSLSGLSISGTIGATSTALLLPANNFGTLTNNGTLIGASNGITTYPATTVTAMINNGTIASAGPGIFNQANISTLTNNAYIGGAQGVLNDASSGAGTIGTLINSNSATIIGATTAIKNTANAVIGTLINQGTIRASNTTNVIFAITNDGAIGTIINSGKIISTGSAQNTAIANANSIATLSNSGIISGDTAISNSGTITSLTISSTGSISGNINAIQNAASGTIGSLLNQGTISGVNAIQNLGVLGTITNSGMIAGNISNTSSGALNINGGGSGTIGTLTGASGGLGSADAGVISNTLSNLNFSSGTLLLNDNIDVTGHTVNNTGATLQLNNHVTITGDYHQSSAGSLVLGVASGAAGDGSLSDGNYGRLIVSGNATIDSGSSVVLKPQSYNFVAGQRFVVVQAGSATYNEGSLNYSAIGFSGNVTGTIDTSSGDSLVLVLTAAANPPSPPSNPSTPPASGYATTNNAISALTGLHSYGGINALLLNVYNPALALNDTTSANRAGAQLNPTAVQQAAANSSNAAVNEVFNVTNNHLDGLRLAQAGSSGVATGEHSFDPALWGQFFGGGATQDERDNVSGYHSNYRGLLIGGDVQASDNWRAGGLFSYAKTNVGNDGNNTGSSASINAYGLTAYAGYDGKPWYVNLLAGLSQQRYSTVRTVSFTGFDGVANGSFNGLQSTLSVQAGYPLALSANTTATPMAGLTYGKLRQNGYTESGGNGAALTVQSATTTSLKSDIGAKLEHKLDTSYGALTPSLQVRWRHEFQDSRLNTAASFAADPTGSTGFTTVGATPVRNTGVMVLGATLARGKNLSLSANYTLEAGRGYHSQTGDIRLRWQY